MHLRYRWISSAQWERWKRWLTQCASSIWSPSPSLLSPPYSLALPIALPRLSPSDICTHTSSKLFGSFYLVSLWRKERERGSKEESLEDSEQVKGAKLGGRLMDDNTHHHLYHPRHHNPHHRLGVFSDRGNSCKSLACRCYADVFVLNAVFTYNISHHLLAIFSHSHVLSVSSSCSGETERGYI